MLELAVSEERLKTAQIPEKFWELDYSTFPWRSRMKKNGVFRNFIQRFLKDYKNLHGCGIYIFGEKGTGRSFLACNVAMELMMHGFSAKYFTYDQLVSLCINGTDSAFFEIQIWEPNLLIVDNVDNDEIRGQGYFRVMKRILQIRQDHERPVILISQLTPTQFHKLFGPDCQNLHTRMFVCFRTPGNRLEQELETAKRNIQYLEEAL